MMNPNITCWQSLPTTHQAAPIVPKALNQDPGKKMNLSSSKPSRRQPGASSKDCALIFGYWKTIKLNWKNKNPSPPHHLRPFRRSKGNLGPWSFRWSGLKVLPNTKKSLITRYLWGVHKFHHNLRNNRGTPKIKVEDLGDGADPARYVLFLKK